MSTRFRAFIRRAKNHPIMIAIGVAWGLLVSPPVNWLLDKIWGNDLYTWLQSATASPADSAASVGGGFVFWAANNVVGVWIIGFMSLVAALLMRMYVESRPEKVVSTGVDETFAIRIVSGDGFATLLDGYSFARLAVRNASDAFLPRCHARLETIQEVVHGHLFGVPNWKSTELEWAPEESARTGQYGEFLNMPNDGIEHFVDVAAQQFVDQTRITVWAADERYRVQLPPSCYRLVITVASHSETPHAKRIEVLMGYGRRDHPPSPILLREWRRGMEQQLEAG